MSKNSRNLCGNRRCLGGWIWWNGSEYPCSACKDISEKAERLREERRERESESYAFLF